MKKIAILYSGGLDSVLMYKYFKTLYPNSERHGEPICIYYNIGQEYNFKELKSIELSNVDVIVKNVDWLTSDNELISKEGSLSGNIIIPGRNAVLSTLAACQYDVDEIWLGALQGEIHDKSTDKNYKFIKKWNDLVSYVLQKDVQIRFPFADLGWGKLDLVKHATAHNWITIDQLKNTSSCLSGEPNNCGHCVVCFRRWGIFTQLGFSEEYNIHPLNVESNLKMALVMIQGEQSGECHYDKYRRDEIIPALKIIYKTENLKNIECKLLELLDQKGI